MSLIFHRLVAININSKRHEGARVSKDDLRIMFAVEMGMPLNYFKIFTNPMRDMVNICETVKGLGCSLLITLLALKKRFYFPSRSDDFKALDFARMVKMKMRDPDTESLIHEAITPSRSSRRASRGGGSSSARQSQSFDWVETSHSYPVESSIVPYTDDYSGAIVVISSDDE